MSEATYIGQQVHYVSYGTPVRKDGSQAFTSRCRAATISETDGGDTVGLVVLNPTGLFFHPLAEGGSEYDPGTAPGGAEQGPGLVGGTWHYLGDCTS